MVSQHAPLSSASSTELLCKPEAGQHPYLMIRQKVGSRFRAMSAQTTLIAPASFTALRLASSEADVAGSPAYRDFTRWKEPDVYSKALERLLRDLKVERA